MLTALARIGSNLNQIAWAMNMAVLKGEYAPGHGCEAREAAGEVKRAIAQLAGRVGRDLDYWGADTKAELPASARRSPKRGTLAPAKGTQSRSVESADV